MKTITSLIAALTVLAAASSAQAFDPKEFFEKQQQYGGYSDDSIRTGATLDPHGLFGNDNR